MNARQHTERMLEWWSLCGITRADLAVRRQTGIMIWHRDRPLLELPLPWARAENVRRADVYVRPARHQAGAKGADSGYAWPLVLLDDLPLDAAWNLARTHRALIVRTSRIGGCHLWIACDRDLTETERKNLQQCLAHQWGADPASTSGEHLGRLAGFKNWKRHGVWVKIVEPTVANTTATTAAALLCSEEVRSEPERYATASIPSIRHHENEMTPSTVATSDKRRCRIEDACEYPDDRAGKPPRLSTPRDTSESAREWGWVCGMLEAGIPPEIVYQRLLDRARRRRGQDAERYTHHTIDRAQHHIQ
jgi:hypothetical protein